MNKCLVQIVSRLDSQSFRCLHYFPAAMFQVCHGGTPIWRLHTGLSILGSLYWSLPARPLTLQPDRLALVHREIRMRSPLCVERNNKYT